MNVVLVLRIRDNELDSFTRETDYLDRENVMKMVDAKPGAEVWYLLNLALWWKEVVAA